jgi:hypothetical protein
MYYLQEFYNVQDEARFASVLIQKTRDEYIKHPDLLAACAAKNFYNFWFLGKTWNITKLNMLIQVPVLVAVLSGIGSLWKRGLLRHLNIVLIFVGSILIAHLPVVAEARHSIPVLAFLAIPASASLESIWTRVRDERATGS